MFTGLSGGTPRFYIALGYLGSLEDCGILGHIAHGEIFNENDIASLFPGDPKAHEAFSNLNLQDRTGVVFCAEVKDIAKLEEVVPHLKRRYKIEHIVYESQQTVSST